MVSDGLLLESWCCAVNCPHFTEIFLLDISYASGPHAQQSRHRLRGARCFEIFPVTPAERFPCSLPCPSFLGEQAGLRARWQRHPEAHQGCPPTTDRVSRAVFSSGSSRISCALARVTTNGASGPFRLDKRCAPFSPRRSKLSASAALSALKQTRW